MENILETDYFIENNNSIISNMIVVEGKEINYMIRDK
jgi:hypothetical protein